ncbi:hypothetical protein KAE78_05625 [Microbacterium sp. NIBRBAC000506063]|nr:hypothetical protein KAE78_05625 [Microbacterium sp. NIBRBAC000506063]
MCIYLYEGETGPATHATCTGADGSWWIGDVTAGEYRVAFADHSGGHHTQWWDGTASGSAGYTGSTALTVTGGQTVTGVNATLAPTP